jgi:predicted CXXCH cytochrome family protein
VQWSPADTVDHTQVVGICSSCHNGTVATGKHPTHISSGENCDDCHTTVAWVPANFDHANITGDCFSCHNGTTATGKHAGHVDSTNVCEGCHSTTAWSPASSVDHSQVRGSCSSCHDGTTATGKFSGHFITARECGECHDTVAWLPHTFQHLGLSYEPLDHRANLLCTACHSNNTETVTWPYSAFAPDCAACHANDFASESDHIGGSSGTVSQNRNCGGSGCHRISDSSFN